MALETQEPAPQRSGDSHDHHKLGVQASRRGEHQPVEIKNMGCLGERWAKIKGTASLHRISEGWMTRRQRTKPQTLARWQA